MNKIRFSNDRFYHIDVGCCIAVGCHYAINKHFFKANSMFAILLYYSCCYSDLIKKKVRKNISQIKNTKVK